MKYKIKTTFNNYATNDLKKAKLMTFRMMRLISIMSGDKLVNYANENIAVGFEITKEEYDDYNKNQ